MGESVRTKGSNDETTTTPGVTKNTYRWVQKIKWYVVIGITYEHREWKSEFSSL
jgi:hypothetical protein